MKKYIFCVPIYCMFSVTAVSKSYWGAAGECSDDYFNKLTTEQKEYHLKHEPHPCELVKYISIVRKRILSEIDLDKSNGQQCRLSIQLDSNGYLDKVKPLNKNDFCFYTVGQVWRINKFDVPNDLHKFTIGIQ